MSTVVNPIVPLVFSFPGIRPINTVEEGIKHGHYTDLDPFISNETITLWPATGEKTLQIICFNREIGNFDYLELLKKCGKQFCRSGANYLLGLMIQVPEDQLPLELKGKHFVAAEPDSLFASFPNVAGDSCYLYVNRGEQRRGLFLLGKDGAEWPDSFAFLAENLALEAP